MNSDYINKLSERKANKFNMMCLVAMSILSLLVIVLNVAGIFTQDNRLIISVMLSLAFLNITPFIVYLIHDKYLKKETILEKRYFKYILLTFAYITALLNGVTLSFHATLLLVIPLLLAAQYRNKKKMFILLLSFSLILIPLVTYGEFYFGIYDANLLKPLTKTEAMEFQNRVNTGTPKRLFEIFCHYCLPRMFCIAVIDFIAVSTTKRTSDMILTQIELNDKVNLEIKNKSEMQKSVIEHLADIIESRDIETGAHIKRTKKYVTIMINKMRQIDKYKNILTDKFSDNIINAAPLHDIGKIVVSDLILCKPGKLTDIEYEKMKIHTTKGGEIINNILNDLGDKEFLNVAYDIACFHHEKWNGQGYPNHLPKEEIPLPARIMAIADVFDALVAERVYKKPIPIEDAIEIIIKDSGTHFDPDLVEVFKTVLDDFKSVAKEKL